MLTIKRRLIARDKARSKQKKQRGYLSSDFKHSWNRGWNHPHFKDILR